jgi:hypothetical protein
LRLHILIAFCVFFKYYMHFIIIAMRAACPAYLVLDLFIRGLFNDVQFAYRAVGRPQITAVRRREYEAGTNHLTLTFSHFY